MGQWRLLLFALTQFTFSQNSPEALFHDLSVYRRLGSRFRRLVRLVLIGLVGGAAGWRRRRRRGLGWGLRPGRSPAWAQSGVALAWRDSGYSTLVHFSHYLALGQGGFLFVFTIQ